MHEPARSGVCLGVQGAQNADYWDRGIARYIVEHAQALLDVAPDLVHSIRASPDLGFPPSLVRLLPSGRLRRTHAEPMDERGSRPLVYHVMSPLEWGHPIDDIWPVWARVPGMTLVVTLYDLIPRIFPDLYSRRAAERIAYDARLELVRRADHLLAISSHTAEDAIRELGVADDRVTVIDAAASNTFRETWRDRRQAIEHVRARVPQITSDFVFYVGGMDERKNLPRLIEAWSGVASELRSTTQLVITCGLRPEQIGELERHAARQGLRREDMVLTGRVDDLDLAALYRACHLFVFASLYEGSGLPILEAMMAGAPVIAARTSTGPEILGELDGTFDPSDAADMAGAIERALRDPARLERYATRSRERVADFSWRKVAERTVEGYESAIDRRRRIAPPVRRTRSRIAILAPASRRPRAADAALRRLATELAAHAEVDLIQGDHGDPEVGAHGPSRWQLAQTHNPYDHTIHVLGDEPAHRHAYESLIRRPGGVVVFEDVRLGAFYRWYGSHVGGALWMRRQLEQQYGAMLPGWISVRGEVTPVEATTHGLFFSREVQRLASHLVVPCQLAADLLHVDRCGEEMPAPVSVLELPPGVAPSVPASGVKPTDIVAVEPLGSAGADLLARALEYVRRDHPAARLTLLRGGAPSSDGQDEPPRDDAGKALTAPERLSEPERQRRIAEAAAVVLPVPAVDAERIAVAREAAAAGVPIVGIALGWPDRDPSLLAEALPSEPSAGQLGAALGRVLAEHASRRPIPAGAPSVGPWLELLGL